MASNPEGFGGNTGVVRVGPFRRRRKEEEEEKEAFSAGDVAGGAIAGASAMNAFGPWGMAGGALAGALASGFSDGSSNKAIELAKPGIDAYAKSRSEAALAAIAKAAKKKVVK
jgi:hypothetical protein